MARGQSLVVWAIADGRRAAKGVDKYLMGETNPRKRQTDGSRMSNLRSEL
jgi:hypothetical protein